MYVNGHMIGVAMWWTFELAVIVVVLWLLFSARGTASKNKSSEDKLSKTRHAA